MLNQFLQAFLKIPLLFFPLSLWAADIKSIIQQETHGSTILAVDYQAMPNENAFLLIINTDHGNKQIIVSPKNLEKALELLQKENLIESEPAHIPIGSL